MAQDDEAVQQLNRGGRDNKEIHRRQAANMVFEECAPDLRWRLRVTRDVPAYRPFRDLEAQLQQLTMNAWGAPQRISPGPCGRMRSRNSRDTGGRPRRRERDFQVQNSRKPLRCQPITVAGLTIVRASRQFGQRLEIKTQNQRSERCSRGRGDARLNAANCWRTAKLSKYEAANSRSSRCRRATKSRMSIFRMAERLSGRRPDCQGFCGLRRFGETHQLGAGRQG